MQITSLKLLLVCVLMKSNVPPESGLLIAIERNQVEKYFYVFFFKHCQPGQWLALTRAAVKT